MATEIQWETDEPREWRAKGPDRANDLRSWESRVTKVNDRRYAWEVIDERFGYVGAKGEATTSEGAKAAVADVLLRNVVAFSTDAATAWPDALRQLLETSQRLGGVQTEDDPNTVAAIRSEHRAAVERARRLLQ